MARSPEAQETRVPITAQAIRRVVGTAALLPLPTEASKPKSEGWQRAEELNKEGYGIIIAHMHANKGDSARVIGRTFRSSTFSRREVFIPNGIHQHKGWYKPVGTPIHVQVFPIFTKETGRLANEDTVLARKLIDEYGIDMTDPQLLKVIAGYTKQYTDHAIPLLQRAGIEIVAPQGHREEAFTTMTTAIESIVKRALQQKIHNIAVLFVGYDIKGVQNYADEKIKNYNLFRRYRFHDGKCLTVDELIKEAGGNYIKLSKIIRGEMQATVPPEYLPKPSSQ
ncbi:MAG: hypothetical protein AAB600_00155 [Patescibacteria group bacterium]